MNAEEGSSRSDSIQTNENSSGSSSSDSDSTSESGDTSSSADNDVPIDEPPPINLPSMQSLLALGPPPDPLDLPPRWVKDGIAQLNQEDFLRLDMTKIRPWLEPALIHRYNTDVSAWEAQSVSVALCPKPFARGAMRTSYYCVTETYETALLVAKKYKNPKHCTSEQVFADVEMHHVANHWAMMYNAYNPPKTVRFVPACALELRGRTPSLWLGLEPYICGHYQKHNSNNGFVATTRKSYTAETLPDSPGSAALASAGQQQQRKRASPVPLRSTPHAFLHFTYQFSGGALMICDIQGVGDLYTDPQILTRDGKGFGRGNVGQHGIKRCLESHQCNAVCAKLGLSTVDPRAMTKLEPSTPTDALATLGPTHPGRSPTSRHVPITPGASSVARSTCFSPLDRLRRFLNLT